jgi:negative regulator of sigma E activity
MNENEHSSQLSALFDGELPAEQSELVIRRAMKDPVMRVTWGRYALIGAAMRSEPLAIHTRLRDDVAARVGARLSMDAAPGAERGAKAVRATGGSGAFARGAWGMAIAASVAAVSLLVMRGLPPAGATATDAPLLADAGVVAAPAGADPISVVAPPPVEQLVVAAEEPLPSYTTPVDDSGRGSRPGGLLVNYVVAHSEVPGSAVRFSPLSTVMNAGPDLAQGTVEMTEAEIGAHR